MKRLSKRHLVRFSVVWMLNLVIAIFSISAVPAQLTAKAEQVRAPITVEVANLPDSPLLVSLVRVDATGERFQKIDLNIQNVSEKSIRGYVLATSYGKAGGETTSTFFPAKPFSKGSLSDTQLVVMDENIKSDTKLIVFIDYVSYTDRTVWGADERKMSDSISGMISGASFAASEFNGMIKKETGLASLDAIVDTPPVDLKVAMPAGTENQSDRWRSGFRSGYKGLVHHVKVHRSDPDFVTQLEEFRKNLQQETRDK